MRALQWLVEAADEQARLGVVERKCGFATHNALSAPFYGIVNAHNICQLRTTLEGHSLHFVDAPRTTSIV